MAFDFFSEEGKKDDTGNQPEGEKQLGNESPVVTGNEAKTSDQGPSSTGSFTNLQKYLDTNQSLNFGTGVAGKVQGQVDAADQAQKQADTDFRGKVNQSSVSEDKDLINRAVSDPTAVVGDKNQFDVFSKMRDAKYTGPNSLSDTPDIYSPVEDKTRNAFGTAEATKTEGGRKSVLDNLYGSGAGRYDYSGGQKNLDNLLVQNDPTSRTAFEDVQKKAATTRDNFGNLTTALNSYAGQKAQETKQTRDDTHNAIGIDDAGNYNGGGAIGSTISSLDTKVKNYNDQKQTERQSLLDSFNARRFDDATLAKTGLQKGQTLYASNPGQRLDLSGYLNSAPDANRSSASSKGDAARVDALTKLANINNSFIDQSQVGSYSPNQANTFDISRLNKTLEGNKAAYQDALNQKNYVFAGNTFGSSQNKETVNPNDHLNVVDYLNRLGGSAAMGAEGRGFDPSYLYSYQKALGDLKNLQTSYGDRDTIGATTPEDDYRRFTDFSWSPVLAKYKQQRGLP